MSALFASQTPLVWVAIVVAAVLIGIDKSLLPGTAILGIGFLASLVPAKEASGITLALIVIGDWSAIWAYRQNVEWRELWRLLPNVGIGVLLGAAFLFVADNTVTKRTIGIIILVFIGINLVLMWRRRREAHSALAQAGEPQSEDAGKSNRVKPLVYGSMAGFTTMVANAGGPATSLYFLSEGFSVVRFLGTSAWFYLIINLVKLPFSVGLGMITWRTILTALLLIPVVVATVLVGRWLSRRIRRDVFNSLVIVLSVVAGVLLLF